MLRHVGDESRNVTLASERIDSELRLGKVRRHDFVRKDLGFVDFE